MGKPMRFITPVLIFVGGLVLLFAMFGMKKPPEKKAEEVKPLLVETATVSKQDLRHIVQSQGTVRPLNNTMLVSEVNGKIIELSDAFIAGGFFSKGDVLVRIDPSDYLTTVKTAQANLARAQASLQEEKARAKVAKVEWDAVMKGNAPDLYLRKPQLARELANVRSAQADLEKARRDLARTQIRAPFDGMVKEKTADIGQFISRGGNLGTVFGTQVAEVRLPLTDTDLAYLEMPSIKNGQQALSVTLTAVDSGKPHQWQASLVRSEGVVDEKSRVTYAVAQLTDPYGLTSDIAALPFGRFVSAQIQGTPVNDVVKLPRHLLTADNTVLMLKENKLDIREVEVIRAEEDYAYISNGLYPGEQYITSVIPNPMNGLAIRSADEQNDEPSQQDPVDNSAIATAGK